MLVLEFGAELGMSAQGFGNRTALGQSMESGRIGIGKGLGLRGILGSYTSYYLFLI
jgi:hypothetical protein